MSQRPALGGNLARNAAFCAGRPERRRATLMAMSALTADQLELLRRACAGTPMWGGSVAIDWLARDVQLLFAMGLIEPDGRHPYRPTALGAEVLDAALRKGPEPHAEGD